MSSLVDAHRGRPRKVRGREALRAARRDVGRDHLVEAAERVFARRGYEGARMQEIADEAGVNKALLHYYFRSKERLGQAIFRQAVGQILPRVYVILVSEQTLEEKVRGVIAAELEFLSAHPYLPAYVVNEINYLPELVLHVFAERGPPPLETQPADAAGARRHRSRGCRARS